MKLRLFLAVAAIACCFPVHAQDGSALVASVVDQGKTAGFQIKASITHGSEKLKIIMRGMNDGSSSTLLYVVTYPKDRRGESVILTSKGGDLKSGVTFSPKTGTKKLRDAGMQGKLFGTNMLIADLMDNFLKWPTHKLVGKEAVGKYDCQIVESRPMGSSSNGYSQVKSWIDPKRKVLMRVDKYRGGRVARVIFTDEIRRSSSGKYNPVKFRVIVPGNKTETKITGTSSDMDQKYAESDFTVDAVKKLAKIN